ncbi:unnamed protein product [Dibothriocephalus latus]|uniref:Uncharacterized protein n=1 Tax=Dibothriocephalus latus TaxID=60516 RepID=A0A3P7P9D9_DIBLA|nr:unnamed protein product [Dibothriocephalus latus]
MMPKYAALWCFSHQQTSRRLLPERSVTFVSSRLSKSAFSSTTNTIGQSCPSHGSTPLS